MENELKYQAIKPDKSLADFVESFWLLQNQSDCNREVVVLPDGRVDLFFTQSATEPFHVTLLGIQTQAGQATIAPLRQTYAISFTRLQSNLFFRPASPTWWTGRVSCLLIFGTLVPTT